MAKLNKRDLIDIVCEKAHVSKRDAKETIDVCFDEIEKAVLAGNEVNISNFGAFVPKKRQSRDGTNPKTHKRITIKEATTVTFRVSKNLKDKLN